MRKSKPTKNKLRTPSAIDAVVLNVDTARVSGWAMSVKGRGHVSWYGELNATTAKGMAEMARVCRQVWTTAQEKGIPAILVLEIPYSQGRTGQGLAKRVGAWELAWRMAGNHGNKILHKTAAEWRSGIGLAGIDREAVRKKELLRAQDAMGCGVEIGPDAAAAICMSVWSRCAVPVLELLPASKQKLVVHGGSRG